MPRRLPSFSMSFRRSLALLGLLLLPLLGRAQINIAPGGNVSQNFNGIGSTATAPLPTGWKADKSATARTVVSYAAAGTATELFGAANIATTATNGIYNFGDGTTAAGGSDRAVGGLSTGNAALKSANLYTQLTNNGTGSIGDFTITYNVKKYRKGSNLAGFRVQLYYSTDGSTWTAAPATFLTSFAADADNTGYATTPGVTTAVSGTLTQTVAVAGSLYLAWNYSVVSGTTTSNAQALGVDDISITANAASTTPTITVSAAALAAFSTTQGTASATQTYTVGGTNLSGTTGITVTPPAGYELGQGATPTYSSSATTVAQTSAGTVASTTISVRLAAATTTGTYNSAITHTSTGATQVDKAVNGTVVPGITTGTIAPTSIAAGSDVTVSYATTGTFGSGNVFSAELSTVTGTFPGTALTTTASTPGSSITVTILGTTAAGSAYLIRVNASIPATSGSASTNTLTVTTPPAAPTVTTTAVSAITSTGASTGGNVTAAGTATVTARGVVYSLSAGPVIGGGGVTQVPAAAGGLGSFSSVLSGLAPGTTYHVAAYATNSVGTSYGADLTFTTDVAVSISAGTVAPASVYPGQSVTVPYTTTGTFNTGNVFSAELSTAAGIFPGTALTSTGGTAGSSIIVTIPAATAAGTGYTIRVLGSNPATTGSASGAFTVLPGVFEPFELTSLGGSYISPAAAITEQSGSWTFFQAINGNSSSEAYNGVRSVRLRGGGYTEFTKTNGLGTVSLNAAMYGTDTGVSFTLQYSLDGGTTFVTVPGTVPAGSLPAYGPTHTFTTSPYSYTLNLSGTVLLRIGTTNAVVGSTSPRITIDDVSLSDYLNPAARLLASPNALTLAATLGQTASATYTLVGQNLPAGTTVSLSSNDPSVLVSTDGGTTYAATATSAAAAASGNLSQPVLVQFTAPATAGTTNAIIANDIASLSLSAPVAVTATAIPVVSYTWTGATSTSWVEPTNWTPSRTAVSTTDVLVFNGTTTPAPTVDLDYATTQTIGQLQFSNAVSATFTNTGDRTLNLSHLSSGADFTLPAGNTLTVFNPSASTTATGLTLQLASGGKATIGGTLVFDAATTGTGGTGAHRLQGSGPNSIEFVSGGIFRAGINFSGNPFGGTTASALANTVVFRNGSRYEQLGGGNPFALTQPATIVSFEPTAVFYVGSGITIPLSMTGRTYGSLEYNVGNTTTNATTGASAVTITGDVTITSGIIGLNVQGGVNLKGSVFVNGGSTLTFTPSSNATVQLNGSTAQTIGGTAPAGALTFGSTANLQVNNPAGVVLARAFTLSRLTLTSGLLTTDATNLLTLANPATLGGGSSTSFVNGPLARTTPAGIATATPFVFPIGKGGFYRPLTLTPATQTAASFYTAEQTEGNTGGLAPGNGLGTAPLARVSTKRRYSVVASNTTPGNFTGTITLSFGAEDYVNVPSSLDFVIAKRDATGPNANLWTNLGRSTNTGTGSGPGGASVAGTLTSASFSDFSDFALGAQNDLSNTNVLDAINPLPVELTAFSAQRQVDKTVILKWNTASEKNSARFEVQRSLDGREYSFVASTAAQGTSTHATAYAALDKAAPGARLYYRLRQVDRDGTSAFSPVVVVVGGTAETAKVELYPNPAHSRVSFIAAAATPYRVLNQLGQPLLLGTTEAGTASIGIETLPTGLYFLELQTATGRTVQKFEKE